MSLKTLRAGLLAALVAPSLTACNSSLDRMGQPPLLTPIGTGLQPPREALPTAYGTLGPRSYHSTWAPGSAEMFQDPRARNVGDVITVSILIDDKAQFGNSSDRSRSQKSSLGFDFGYGVSGLKDSATADAGIRSGTARLKAPKTRLRSLAQVRLRMPTAAGKVGLSTVPSGAMQVKGRVRPEFSSNCGFSVYRT